MDDSDIERLLTFYFWDYRMSAKRMDAAESSKEDVQSGIVIRNGKAYRRVSAKNLF